VERAIRRAQPRNYAGKCLVQTDIMKTTNESSSDPQVHSDRIQQQLEELIQHARADVGRVSEPRFQALLETTAEVLTGLKIAYQHYGEKREKAWGGSPADAR
jgi:hypothetical protein